ncbi:MAG: biotin transporter BioY [Candidatus Gastranaerophilales bacterium]|nr:biotin transporter BioY [Candidatus Gastranaerophilales bacterium]
MTETNINNQEQQKPKTREPQYSPLRLIGILTITLFCTVLLIVATFTRIKLFNCLQPLVNIIHPSGVTGFQSIFAFKPYYYIPQIPMILFTSSLLGGACGMTSVFFYIVIGLLFLPVFALGGGFDYILQPGFGYILAFLPASLFAGLYVEKNYTVLKLLKTSFFAVLIIHLLGFIYMLLVSFLMHDKIPHIMDWLLFESLTRAVFDFIFGFLFMWLGKFLKRFIWILTSV